MTIAFWDCLLGVLWNLAPIVWMAILSGWFLSEGAIGSSFFVTFERGIVKKFHVELFSRRTSFMDAASESGGASGVPACGLVRPLRSSISGSVHSFFFYVFILERAVRLLPG